MVISRVFFALLTLAMVSACTVNYSFTGADIPAEAETFSVKTFQLQTPQAAPGYGQLLSESFKDLMLAQTRLDLIDKKGDLQFEGVITEYEVVNAAVSSDEFTTLNRLQITVKVKYTNTFDQEKSFEKSFTKFADFESDQNFTTLEDQLVEDINQQLTQEIFDASLGAW
jgi:hypothetical protein